MKVQELTSPPRPSATVHKSVISCLEATYRFLFENCYELFKRNFAESDMLSNAIPALPAAAESDEPKAVDSEAEPNQVNAGISNEAQPAATTAASKSCTVAPDEFGPSCTKNLDFWSHLINLIFSVIDEDKTVYSQYLNQFPNELNLGKLSAITMWTEFSKDLQIALAEHSQIPVEKRSVQSPQYMNLHFRVKMFYNQYVQNIQVSTDNVKHLTDVEVFLLFLTISIQFLILRLKKTLPTIVHGSNHLF